MAAIDIIKRVFNLGKAWTGHSQLNEEELLAKLSCELDTFYATKHAIRFLLKIKARGKEEELIHGITRIFFWKEEGVNKLKATFIGDKIEKTYWISEIESLDVSLNKTEV